MSLRCTMRSPASCAATISGLSGLMALENTTVFLPSTFFACWPNSTVMPRLCRRSVLALGSRSEPSTSTPCSCSISASTLMPAPPMPMKCVAPRSCTVSSGANDAWVGSRIMVPASRWLSDTIAPRKLFSSSFHYGRTHGLPRGAAMIVRPVNQLADRLARARASP